MIFMDLDNKVNDLMKEWIIFRDECLSRITEEDKGHLIEFDKYCDNILKMLQVVIKNMFKNNWTSLMKIILITLVIGMINIIGLVLVIA